MLCGRGPKCLKVVSGQVRNIGCLKAVSITPPCPALGGLPCLLQVRHLQQQCLLLHRLQHGPNCGPGLGYCHFWDQGHSACGGHGLDVVHNQPERLHHRRNVGSTGVLAGPRPRRHLCVSPESAKFGHWFDCFCRDCFVSTS